jgi:hypothetical protein
MLSRPFPTASRRFDLSHGEVYPSCSSCQAEFHSPQFVDEFLCSVMLKVYSHFLSRCQKVKPFLDMSEACPRGSGVSDKKSPNSRSLFLSYSGQGSQIVLTANV